MCWPPRMTEISSPAASHRCRFESGAVQINPIARQVADTYDRELERSLRAAVALIEPALILFFAVLVGFVALAMLQAIYSVNAGTALTSNMILVTTPWSFA